MPSPSYVPVIAVGRDVSFASVAVTGAAGITFGATGDVNLYRGGPDVLQTDDYLVMPNGQCNGSFALFGGGAETLKLGTVGGGLAVKEGANARSGVATLVAGTVTVANTSVTATTRIQLTAQSLGTVASPKALAVTARAAGASFTITSADVTDTSVVHWFMTEPAS